jgi:hypothetical protein
MKSISLALHRVLLGWLVFATPLLFHRVLAADKGGQTFATPELAVAALAEAVNATNHAALRKLFGAATENLINPDGVQAANDFAAFSKALSETNHLERESGHRCVLELGTNQWPFPVPLVENNGQWFFDTAAGKEELINRRIGRNELDTLKTVRAYVEAQREYASVDHDSSGVLKYAQRLVSSPGSKDGLYWPPDLDGDISPLGPLVAAAQEEGYGKHLAVTNAVPEPFHGYFYKILTRQGKNAPGGKYNYIINGNMIAGFALVAWPAQSGDTGMMTFIVNQQGRVYQKDLGPKTAKLAADMKEYDPDSSWKVSPD